MTLIQTLLPSEPNYWKYIPLFIIFSRNCVFTHSLYICSIEEYRIFQTINLDKNDDFVYSTKNVYLYFAVGLFLNKNLDSYHRCSWCYFFLNKAIKVF